MDLSNVQFVCHFDRWAFVFHADAFPGLAAGRGIDGDSDHVR